MNISQAIEHLLEARDMSDTQMQNLMHEIMTGQCTDAQIAGLLIALHAKGETVTEISAAAQVMRKLADKVVIDNENSIDLAGTGGDASGTFNISTAASFVIAACDATVAKHGNRSVSSKSGSADLLEAAGVRLDLSPAQVVQCVNEIGMGFMFAPVHHSAMKYAIGPRKEMGVRTIFNLLGPLTNPAGVKRQLVGVFAKKWVKPIAEVLKTLGCRRAMVVHSDDGMDEISIAAPTYVAELNDAEIETYTISPEQFGFTRSLLDTIKVSTPKDSLKLINAVFNNSDDGVAKDIVCLNAGAAVYVAGLTDSIADGIDRAKKAIETGAALKKLDALIKFSNKV